MIPELLSSTSELLFPAINYHISQEMNIFLFDTFTLPTMLSIKTYTNDIDMDLLYKTQLI